MVSGAWQVTEGGSWTTEECNHASDYSCLLMDIKERGTTIVPDHYTHTHILTPDQITPSICIVKHSGLT